MKKNYFIGLSLIALLGLASCKENKYTAIRGLDTSEEVSFEIAIPYETDKGLTAVVNEFEKKYPNVTVNIRSVENYNTNAVELLKSNKVDIIYQHDLKYSNSITFTEDDKKTVKTSDDIYYDFKQDAEIDFTNTYDNVMGNYAHVLTDDLGTNREYMYCVPIGGEVRGLFVNKTLLSSFNLDVPKTWDQFLNCCKVVKENGLIPIQGNAGSAAMAIMLATSVNDIVKNPESYEMLKNASSGISEKFQNSFEKMYTLAVNRYYDYKASEENGDFKVSSDIGQAREFLHLKKNDDTFIYEKPENNYGYAAFFPYLSYMSNSIQKLIEDYNLSTEFEFIITPTSDDGNNPAYLTPYYGLSLNKNSTNLIWLREFINFLFSGENNKLYADNSRIIPNTKDAMEYMSNLYNTNTNNCTSCGDILFSDAYNAYTPIANALVNTSKCCAPKYMIKLNKNESNEIQYLIDDNQNEYLLTNNGSSGTKILKKYVGQEEGDLAFCTLKYYLDQLETSFEKFRS